MLIMFSFANLRFSFFRIFLSIWFDFRIASLDFSSSVNEKLHSYSLSSRDSGPQPISTFRFQN